METQFFDSEFIKVVESIHENLNNANLSFINQILADNSEILNFVYSFHSNLIPPSQSNSPSLTLIFLSLFGEIKKLEKKSQNLAKENKKLSNKAEIEKLLLLEKLKKLQKTNTELLAKVKEAESEKCLNDSNLEEDTEAEEIPTQEDLVKMEKQDYDFLEIKRVEKKGNKYVKEEEKEFKQEIKPQYRLNKKKQGSEILIKDRRDVDLQLEEEDTSTKKEEIFYRKNRVKNKIKGSLKTRSLLLAQTELNEQAYSKIQHPNIQDIKENINTNKTPMAKTETRSKISPYLAVEKTQTKLRDRKALIEVKREQLKNSLINGLYS